MSDKITEAFESVEVEDAWLNPVRYGVEIIVETQDHGEIVFYEQPTDPIYDQLKEKGLL